MSVSFSNSQKNMVIHPTILGIFISFSLKNNKLFHKNHFFIFQDTTKATSTTTTRSRSRSDSDIGDLLFEDEDEILYPSSSNGGASTESGIVER